MAIEVITREDLFEFKRELLKDIAILVKSEETKKQKWLKSGEVKQLLNISSGTLQNLRINGTLTYTKVGGTLYFDSDDIDKLLQQNKKAANLTLFK